MPKLFISYRRKSWPFTYRLAEKLEQVLDASIFVDIEGVDEDNFERSILRNLRESDAILLIISEHTFSSRIYDDDDWVRREIREALTYDKPIILAAIEGHLPPKGLPEDIRGIYQKQAINFYPEFFSEATERLADFISRAVDIKRQNLTKPDTGKAHETLQFRHLEAKIPETLGAGKRIDIETGPSPLDFRKEEVAAIFHHLGLFNSVSVVSVGSVGRSNFIQHMTSKEVIHHYLGEENNRRNVLIPIDPALLLIVDETTPKDRTWAAYELLLHRLFLRLYPFEQFDERDIETIYRSYTQLQDLVGSHKALLAVRYFESAMSIIIERGYQIVFIFDDFETMLKRIPVEFFVQLRGLRDLYKRGLLFITLTRQPLPDLAFSFDLSLLELEPFIELVRDTIYLASYNSTDAHRLLLSLAKRAGKSVSNEIVEALITISGAFAGIMRVAFNFVVFGGNTLDANMIASPEFVTSMVRRSEGLRTECYVIWSSLSDSEQAILKAIADGEAFSNSIELELAVDKLVQKRLIRVDSASTQVVISPPIFRAYVANRSG